ncbi:MAG: CoA pyrophosphatase [Micrococcales bacterium]|nr:CoA pyrophosphatase [Micrococcales bacterium]
MSVPHWLDPLVTATVELSGEALSRFTPPDDGGRRSAVLVLFGEGDQGPDVLLIQRAPDMRSHAGQPAFPGGAEDPQDGGPVGAALREAQEETGLDPAGVEVIHTLPELWLPPTGFVVTPVLAWWEHDSPVSVMDPAEVAQVHRVPLSELTDPQRRVSVRHPTGYVSPGFTVRGMLVWGFTALLLDRIIALAGWERPWDSGRIVDIGWTG